jgi:predicted DNA-binding ribbon-helix-helix protein
VHLSELVGHIDGERQHCNLSSAIRMFLSRPAGALRASGIPRASRTRWSAMARERF